jgi:predicted MFS family arabinose efflux permease
MLMSNAYYVFMDNYISTRFQVGTLGTSMAMLVLGAMLAFSAAVLVAAAGKRFSKQTIVVAALVGVSLSAILFVLTPSVAVTYLAILPFGLLFGVGYPTLLSVFSASVGESEQGWVMGVSTALFTLGAGLISLVGGDLMALNIRYPFAVAVGAAVVALVLLATVWRAPDVRRLTGKQDS